MKRMDMKVKLLRYTSEPERTVALAAKLCYSPLELADLDAKLDQETIQNFVLKLIDLGHFSALEHASFTFAAEGVSRALTHQLVRHRIASYSQQSQRYVSGHNFAPIMPLSVQANAHAAQRFTQLMNNIKNTYDELIALGIDKEDARYVLPNAAGSKLIITMNARSLFNFFELRCCQRAQWEIRRLAEIMLAEAKKTAPVLFSKAGPSCVTRGICREGELSCGRLRREKAQ